ncbi:MAG TPA: 6-phosphogluconolactonase [Candidatus Dormibacteraeota bacterium]|nr:6-phosphogluconolactonase [Candidatus Dormibacteraeota bacterium]
MGSNPTLSAIHPVGGPFCNSLVMSKPSPKPELRVVSDLEELERAGAGEFARLARGAGPKRPFTVALSGGATPRGAYTRVTQAPYRDLVPWPALQFFWGDERHVPPDHPDSNYRMALETLLSKVPVPPGNVHRIPAESPDAAAAASAYESTLKSYFGLKEGQAPRFDLILLGLGADGHVASLFPGSEALREPRRLVTAPWVEPMRARRITLTPPVIRNAASVMVLVSGDAKAEALRRALAPEGSLDECPARLLQEARGRVVVIADRGAAHLVR